MSRLGPVERRLLIALRATPGPLNAADLAEIIYGDQEDGGPLTAVECIGVHIYRLRRRLGLAIPVDPTACAQSRTSNGTLGWRLTDADRRKLNARAA